MGGPTRQVGGVFRSVGEESPVAPHLPQKRGLRPRFVRKMWYDGAIRTSATSSGRELRVQLVSDVHHRPEERLEVAETSP
jgi:hypothetical protein